MNIKWRVTYFKFNTYANGKARLCTTDSINKYVHLTLTDIAIISIKS